MRNAFYQQFLLNLEAVGRDLSLHRNLREILKTGDIPQFEKLEEFFSAELPNAPLQDQPTVDHYLFIAQSALQYYFFRADYHGFYQVLEILRHRMGSVKNVGAEVDVESWDQYLKLVPTAFARLLRHISIEKFESSIDEIQWKSLSKDFIASISTILGYVYLKEAEADQKIKARIWLQKSLSELDKELGLMNNILLSHYFLGEGSANSVTQAETIEAKLDALSNEGSTPLVKSVYGAARFELSGYLMGSHFSHFDDSLTRLEHCQQMLRELETNFVKREDLPGFSQAEMRKIIAELYAKIYGMTYDDLEQASFAKSSQKYILDAIEWASGAGDRAGEAYFRQTRNQLCVSTNEVITEKEVKETVQFYKRLNDFPAYIKAVTTMKDLLIRNEVSAKSFDLIMDVFKFGAKKIDQGGFNLFIEGFEMANDVFLKQTKLPGVSWMVYNLDQFFEKVKEVIDDIPEWLEVTGRSAVERFRNTYVDFEPVSHFNVKVYYMYQLYEIKMMRIGALLQNDKISLKLADRLLKELDNEDNPLYFINGKWEDGEFKDVPNSVRNNTLNKCINISKGDLPLAAEHLDFSYRNLRSYITFKEVNRLGFFLEQNQTDNRQLEQGIRYMFYDLYKKGTIFEVVFDMPKFLVEYSKSGFYSQDLERELNIKGTTAKKYIKIMMEIGLIRQDKTTGRKHYYRLIREHVMNRLGEHQATLIQSQ